MRKAKKLVADELRSEYERSDFGALVHGKYIERLKTCSNVVVIDPEVADLFLGHGRREIVDAYTEKRFGAVRKAVKRVGRKLASIFQGEAFPLATGKKAVSNASISPVKIQQMKDMREAGRLLKEIAAECDVAISTVLRYTKKEVSK